MNVRLMFLWLICVWAQAQAHEESLAISDQTFLVYRRYYFIARLEKTIRLLAKFSQDSKSQLSLHIKAGHVIDDFIALPEIHQLSYGCVKHSVESICTTRSLKPLFMVWDAFSSYKSLKDDLFVEDFSKEIFIVTRVIAQRLHLYDEIKSLPLDLNLVCRCDAISNLTECIENYMSSDGTASLARGHDISDLALTIHTDEVAFRYYLLHRIDDAISCLKAIPQTVFHELHTAVKDVVRVSGKHNVLGKRSFVQLWDDCKQYKFIDDEAFMRAFLLEVTLLLQLYDTQQKSGMRKLNYVQLMHIYQQINKLPIEEILNGIDFLVTNMIAISDDYHKQNLTVSEWVKEYWWAPPLVAATIIFQCVKFYYKKYYPR